MYRCSFCKKNVPARTPCKKVVKTKLFNHPFRPKVHKRWGYDKAGRLRQEWIDDKGGTGPQIVSEYPICHECAAARGMA